MYCTWRIPQNKKNSLNVYERFHTIMRNNCRKNKTKKRGRTRHEELIRACIENCPTSQKYILWRVISIHR
jgi:hypothetical protein